MNGLGRLSRALNALRSERGMYAGAERDDRSLTRHMRSLAVELRVDGRAPLVCPAFLPRELQALSKEAGEVLTQSACPTPVLERLHQDARIMEACAAQARLDGGVRLPAVGREPRILKIMREIASLGDTHLNADRLMLALASFDDVQALTMAEIWAAPTALRRALAEAFCLNARSVIERGRERSEAERFVDTQGRGAGRYPDTSAFYERALKLTVEQEIPELRARLEGQIARMGESGEKLIRLEHEAQALLSMRLDNLVSAKRMIDALDWQKCFRELSRTEAELMGDPDGTYPRMDDESRSTVRAQVSLFSQRLKIGEQTVAHQAVAAAKEFPAGDPRSTVCWWLYDDGGRQALVGRLGIRGSVPKLVPDPKGHKLISAIITLAVLLFIGYALLTKSFTTFMLGIPLAWGAAMMVVGRIAPHVVRPHRLLKLEIERLERDQAALVVMPALLSSTGRARELLDGLEALGCLDTDENVQYLLLGDFRDADTAGEPADREILEVCRARVREMNRRAGREKYLYLHRNRTFYAPDRRFMGHERKRGALMELNRLLLGISGAESAFQAEGAACEQLSGRYGLVVTIDADTRMIPGTVRALVGAMLHPLNRPRTLNGVRRGFAILQPNMELAASASTNQFIRLFAGTGGVDAYPVSVSNLYQDFSGSGSFAGKGIYDVRAFMDALEGTLPDGRILSHDLIEGEYARAAFVSDISLYDGFPETFSAYLKRLNRWTRGDWQILPYLFKRGLSGLSRLKIFDNLIRSLIQPSLMGLLLQAMWFNVRTAFALGVLYAFLTPILHLFTARSLSWRRAVVGLAALPATSGALMDAVLRTIFRLAFSKKHMLEWVTSADAAAGGTRVGTACRVGAILCIPGLFSPAWVPPALSLAALFLLAPGLIADMQTTSTDARGSLTVRQIGALSELARDTWRFFEKYVTERENWLPPDNVQIDPAVGSARRTSPTNVGLYLLSCLSARALGFLRDREMLSRVRDTMDSVEKLDKWNGHLYNWYDIDSLRPLKPRYVSAVDSGNLAACLMTLAAAIESLDRELTDRLRTLAAGMDFLALYDPSRKLFVIGADVENGRLSASHYDLLASESRILSYVAMMLGQVSVSHWKKLARPSVRLEHGQALVSWSGTMFEYLMPEIFMRSRDGTLLSESNRAVAQMQARLGALRGRPWGVSESGYYAFDLHLNYQYRAFGLRELALGGGVRQCVVAPYASVLALATVPGKVADNVLRMRELGWAGECGLYEAADYAASRRGEDPKLVKSYMAHHQGMMLSALANALSADAITNLFERIPEARALSLLLEEKPSARVRLRRRQEQLLPDASRRPEERTFRFGRVENRLVDQHILAGAGARAILTARGQAFLSRNGVLANRFFGDLIEDGAGIAVYVRDPASGRLVPVAEDASVRFDAGFAQFASAMKDVDIKLTATVSPEDGTLIQRVSLWNRADANRALELTQAFPVALCYQADCYAHPAFQNLFVTSERPGQNVLLFTRRAGGPGGSPYALAAMLFGARVEGWETDYGKLVSRAGEMEGGLGGTLGNTLNPCSAIRAKVQLEPGEKREVHFAVGLVEPSEVKRWVDRNASDAAPERARQLAYTQSRAMLGFVGLNAESHHLLARASAFLIDPRLSARAKRPGTGIDVRRQDLWALGISGDFPILAVSIGERAQLSAARDAVRAHEFYRTVGLCLDLVLINDYGNDYEQPVRDALKDMIACSHLREQVGVPGGVHVLDSQQISSEQRAQMQRVAAVFIDGGAGAGFWSQLRAILGALEFGGRAAYRPLEPRGFKLKPVKREFFNGYGGFSDEGYAIDAAEPTPSAWSNVLARDGFGALITERGGGFLFGDNSRECRLTPFRNDPLVEGWGFMLYLADEKRGAYLRLLPGDRPITPFRATHGLEKTRFESGAEGLEFSTTAFAHPDEAALGLLCAFKNSGSKPAEYAVTLFVDWLMGVDARDAQFVRAWTEGEVCLASGAAPGVGYMAALDERAEAGAERAAFLGHGGAMRPDGLFERRGGGGGWALKVKLAIKPGEEKTLSFAIGHALDRAAALSAVERLRQSANPLGAARALWDERLEKLRIRTPDAALNRLISTLPKQVLDSRMRARAGLYQAGGAYGFRDQLQDMLAMIPYEPDVVRKHLLRAAARQFEDGDVLHWWHMPYMGVRTRISDDCLFLPFVLSSYVLETGDRSVLFEEAPYLVSVDIPEEAEDWCGVATPSELRETLHRHCMRAFQRAARTGEHGLALMGGGDWNDGMNRVGARGKGESVWLSEFLSAAACQYAEIAPDEGDRAWLNALSAQMNAAVEEFGWDGQWYLRAYFDDAAPLGSASGSVCRIDAIAQAWAALAGLDRERVRRALDSAWENLVDEDRGIVKLLTPPFDGANVDPGYIMAYPPGVRENGGQYTHGACWLALAYIRMGDQRRAHRALSMLNPVNHARTRADADVYRVEPYVLAADVYSEHPHAGRGGWTWYTGAASWYFRAVLALLGYERRGDDVRLRALLNEWDECEVSVRFGSSIYRLLCRKNARQVSLDGEPVPGDWIRMTDDGKEHEAVFPPRRGGEEALDNTANDHIPNKFFR